MSSQANINKPIQKCEITCKYDNKRPLVQQHDGIKHKDQRQSKEITKQEEPILQQIMMNKFIKAQRKRLVLLYPNFLQSQIDQTALTLWKRLSEDEKILYYKNEESKIANQQQNQDLLPIIKQKISKLRRLQRLPSQINFDECDKQQATCQQRKEQIQTKTNQRLEQVALITQANQTSSQGSNQQQAANNSLSLSTCVANVDPQPSDMQQKFILVECKNMELNQNQISKVTNVLIYSKNQGSTDDCNNLETIAVIQQHEAKTIFEDETDRNQQTAKKGNEPQLRLYLHATHGHDRGTPSENNPESTEN